MSKYVGFRLGKVHESYVISEYYCGGCGYPVTDHDSFCPECGGAFRECDASNLEDENARLRKLVAKYSAAAKYLCGFSHCNECNLDCASVFGDVPSGWDCARMLLDKEARKLGIEVD